MLDFRGRLRLPLVLAGLLPIFLLHAVLHAGSAGAAAPVAKLYASFTPDRLGASTTIAFGFRLATPAGLAPPPLTALALKMPAGLNYTTTTLGLAICEPAVLLAQGVAGCSPNSRLGYGSARVEVPFGSGSGHEIPEIQALEGPTSPAGNQVVLFYATGHSPVSAQLVFRGEVLPAYGRFGSQLNTVVPLVPTVPSAPDVSIISAQSTIGPNRLTYYRYVHGRKVAFHPRGVAVPERCPPGGFPFDAQFSFQDGSQASASASVPCPSRRG
jgi:hypothetical protein